METLTTSVKNHRFLPASPQGEALGEKSKPDRKFEFFPVKYFFCGEIFAIVNMTRCEKMGKRSVPVENTYVNRNFQKVRSSLKKRAVENSVETVKKSMLSTSITGLSTARPRDKIGEKIRRNRPFPQIMSPAGTFRYFSKEGEKVDKFVKEPALPMGFALV